MIVAMEWQTPTSDQLTQEDKNKTAQTEHDTNLCVYDR